MIHQYFAQIHAILDQVEQTQQPAMEQAARLLCDATLQGKQIYAFGCNHGGLVAMELFYRTGGLANIQLMRFPGLCLDMLPPTLTTQFEALSGYGDLMLNAYPLGAGDVLILHSVSGKNMVTIDVALGAKARGALVIALTNVALSKGSKPCHPSGKHLYEIADVVIDNCGGPTDALLSMEGSPQKVAPASTVVGAAIVNAVVAQTAQLLHQNGCTPPILASSNAEGGAEYNQKLLQK